MPEHSPANDPLEGLEIMARDTLWNVALAHAELQTTRGGVMLSSPAVLPRYEAALDRIDYLALGHYHHSTQSAYGRTVVRYSGSVSLLVGTGEVTLIEFSHPDGPAISSHSVRV